MESYTCVFEWIGFEWHFRNNNHNYQYYNCMKKRDMNTLVIMLACHVLPSCKFHLFFIGAVDFYTFFFIFFLVRALFFGVVSQSVSRHILQMWKENKCMHKICLIFVLCKLLFMRLFVLCSVSCSFDMEIEIKKQAVNDCFHIEFFPCVCVCVSVISFQFSFVQFSVVSA